MDSVYYTHSMVSRRTHESKGTLHLPLHYGIGRRQAASRRGQMRRRNQTCNRRHADMRTLQILDFSKTRAIFLNLLAVKEALLLQLVARI